MRHQIQYEKILGLCPCALFAYIYNSLHSCTATTVFWQKIQRNTCHRMASLAFIFYKIQFRPRCSAQTPLGSLRRSSRPPSPDPSSFPQLVQRTTAPPLRHEAPSAWRDQGPQECQEYCTLLPQTNYNYLA